MTKEEDELDYVDSVVSFFHGITERNAHALAVDLWKYYPVETKYLLESLEKTQYMQKVPRLLQKGM